MDVRKSVLIIGAALGAWAVVLLVGSALAQTPRLPITLNPNTPYGQQQLPSGSPLSVQPGSSTGDGGGLLVPEGTAPPSPLNGQCWTTSAGLFCHDSVAGTVGPFTSNGGGTGGTILLCTLVSSSGSFTAFNFTSTSCPAFPGVYKDYFLIMNYDIGHVSTNEDVALQLSNNNGSTFDSTAADYFTQTFDQNSTATAFSVSSNPGINLLTGSSGVTKGYIYNLGIGTGGAQGGLLFDFSSSGCVNCNSLPSLNSRLSRGFYAGSQTSNNAFRLILASGNPFLASISSVSLYGISQ